MPEPAAATAIATVASTLASSITLVRFISDIKNTPADVKTCFDLTRRIEADLQALISLRTRHEKYLLTVPGALKRIDDIVYSTKDSILDVCKLLEGCRAEVYEGNSIPLGSKLKWVLGDSVAFTRRTANLQQQHAAINVEIACLRQMDMLKPLERIATTTFENVELLTMERKRAKKRDYRGNTNDRGN